MKLSKTILYTILFFLMTFVLVSLNEMGLDILALLLLYHGVWVKRRKRKVKEAHS